MPLLQLDDVLCEAAAEVMEAMFFMGSSGERMDSFPDMSDWIGSQLSYCGNVRGSFGIRTSPQLAWAIAANFLCEEISAIDRQRASEVLDELANMICGSVLNRVDPLGIYQLSHPEPSERLPESSTLVSNWLRLDEGFLYLWWYEVE